MNKQDLVDVVAIRTGDRHLASDIVHDIIDTIQGAVASGDKVSIVGFGVFEKSERAARTARNPATGAVINVPEKSVPKFRPGADFRAAVDFRPVSQ